MKNILLICLMFCAWLSPAQSLYNNYFLSSLCCDSSLFWNEFWHTPLIYKFSAGKSTYKRLNVDPPRTYLANEDGELQFVSNGCKIMDAEGNLVSNKFGLLE